MFDLKFFNVRSVFCSLNGKSYFMSSYPLGQKT
jgi:hypothetical protein